MSEEARPKVKLSLTVDAAAVDELRARCGDRGLSSVVNRAVWAELERLRRDEALDALVEGLIREHGRPSARMVERFEALWDER